jgi:GNAT superfamily N-acetyltransferase
MDTGERNKTGRERIAKTRVAASLRPTRPIHISVNGMQSCEYQVYVNDRPVGTTEIATDPMSGHAAGVLRSLVIGEPMRRRGLGTAAGLAAEDILRQWGCRQVMAYAAADITAAVRLLHSLRYSEVGSFMVKSLRAGAIDLPSSVTARPMTAAEARDWLTRSTDDFVQAWISRGARPEHARARVRAITATALPDGVTSADVAIRLLFHEDQPVGRLWVSRSGYDASPQGAYVYEIEVLEPRRGEGFGRALMLLAEQIALAWGETTIGLQVFNANTPAIRLYESLGYASTSRVFLKDLE